MCAIYGTIMGKHYSIYFTLFFRKNRIVLDKFSNLISLDANPKWRHV